MKRLTFFEHGKWWLKLCGTLFGDFPAVNRLAAYEDTGLEPEDIVDLQRAWDMYGGEDGITAMLALTPNPPLTLEELREMDGEPVYILSGDFADWRVPDFIDEGAYKGFIRFTDRSAEPITDYGKVWFAYRRKPEEGTTKNV